MKRQHIILISLIPFFFATTSCKEKGPAEKMGEKIDETVEKMEDAVDEKGPLEEAGEKIDEALEE